MEVLQLTYFRYAAEYENFSSVAVRFGVPASSVSASIRKLERELEVPLFDRTANRIKLNDCGKLLWEAILKSEAAFRYAKNEMNELSQTFSGEIHLLILTNRRIVTDAISQFKRLYPHVTFIIKHASSSDLSNEQAFDIIVSDRRPDPTRFTEMPLIREEILLAVHKDDPLAGCTRVDPTELKRETFISMPKGSSIRDYMDDFFRHHGISPRIAIECDDPEYIRKYVAMGLGVTFFPSVSWKGLESEDTVLLPIGSGIKRHSALYLNRQACRAACLFADHLKGLF